MKIRGKNRSFILLTDIKSLGNFGTQGILSSCLWTERRLRACKHTCACVHVYVFQKLQKVPPAAFKTKQIRLRPGGNLK